MLNKEQRTAVDHEGSHLVIVAGPGTGKTSTVVERICRRIPRLAAHNRILAITFTNKAAREMATRLSIRGCEPARCVDVGTFHAFSLGLLRRYESCLKFPLTFSIASPDEIAVLARTLWPERSASERRRTLKKIADWKASLRSSSDDPDVHAFRGMLRDQGVVDFDDILRDAVLLLRERPDIRREVRDIYRHIFVDEYQDVSAVQVALLKELVGDGVVLTAIGDPNQAIYGFRGSDVRYFEAFPRDFPPATVLGLSRNYRSGADLVSAGGQVIARDAVLPVPPLTAEMHTRGLLKVQDCATDSAEAEYVAHTIEKLVGGTSSFSRASGRVGDGDGGRSFGDIAVLYRLNTQGRLVQEALDRLGVPCQVAGDRAPELGSASRAALKTASAFENPAVILASLRSADAGLDKNWDYFLAIAEGSRSVAEFLDKLALETPEDHYLAKAEKISLMTLHAAKGLEFPVVFIVGCEEGLLPLDMETFVSDVGEERRLFYVGLTRAREELYLVRARRRSLYGKTMALGPSRFLGDIAASLKSYEEMQPRKIRRDPQRDQLKMF